MNHNIQFDVNHQDINRNYYESQLTNCHEFLKSSYVTNRPIVFYVPYKKLNVPLADIKMLIKKLNDINDFADIEYFGIEPQKHVKGGFEKNHIFGFKKKHKTKEQDISIIILMNILRWTFQSYALSTSEYFIKFVKKGIDPLQALLMAQMLMPHIGGNSYNIIVSKTLSVPIFYPYQAFIKKKRADGTMGFQYEFSRAPNEPDSIFHYDRTIFNESKKLLLADKINDFITLMKKHDLWIEN